jgi:hypothetical protein
MYPSLDSAHRTGWAETTNVESYGLKCRMECVQEFSSCYSGTYLNFLWIPKQARGIFKMIFQQQTLWKVSSYMFCTGVQYESSLYVLQLIRIKYNHIKYFFTG